MSNPNLHSKSSAKKFGGIPEDYIHLHEWLDETKGWIGDSLHRMFRHHSEGIFEMEKRLVRNSKIVMEKLFTLDMLENNMLRNIVIITFHRQKNGLTIFWKINDLSGC